MTSDIETFKFEVEAYIERSNISSTAFGVDAAEDVNFISQLRLGRRVGRKMQGRVIGWMAAQAFTPVAVNTVSPTSSLAEAFNRSYGIFKPVFFVVIGLLSLGLVLWAGNINPAQLQSNCHGKPCP